MFILLDENLLSKKLKKLLVDVGYSVQNVEDMGWRGVKDQELLRLAEAHPFNVFISADKNLPYQQNLIGARLRVVILDVMNTRPDYLLPLMIQMSKLLPLLALSSVTLMNDAGEAMPFSLGSSE